MSGLGAFPYAISSHPCGLCCCTIKPSTHPTLIIRPAILPTTTTPPRRHITVYIASSGSHPYSHRLAELGSGTMLQVRGQGLDCHLDLLFNWFVFHQQAASSVSASSLSPPLQVCCHHSLRASPFGHDATLLPNPPLQRPHHCNRK